MITKYKLTFTTFALTSILGCFPGGVAVETDTGETGDQFETGDESTETESGDDSNGDGDGDPGDGDGDPAGDGDGDGDPVDPCADAPEPIFDCDQDGRCWTIAPGWSAWARYAEPGILAAWVDAEIIWPTLDQLGIDGECYDVVDSEIHTCVVKVDCVPLLTTPLSEVDLAPSDCAGDGPWASAVRADDPSAQCVGELPTVVVELNVDEPIGWCCSSLAPDLVCEGASDPGECDPNDTWCPTANGLPDCE